MFRKSVGNHYQKINQLLVQNSLPDKIGIWHGSMTRLQVFLFTRIIISVSLILQPRDENQMVKMVRPRPHRGIMKDIHYLLHLTYWSKHSYTKLK